MLLCFFSVSSSEQQQKRRQSRLAQIELNHPADALSFWMCYCPWLVYEASKHYQGQQMIIHWLTSAVSYLSKLLPDISLGRYPHNTRSIILTSDGLSHVIKTQNATISRNEFYRLIVSGAESNEGRRGESFSERLMEIISGWVTSLPFALNAVKNTQHDFLSAPFYPTHKRGEGMLRLDVIARRADAFRQVQPCTALQLSLTKLLNVRLVSRPEYFRLTLTSSRTRRNFHDSAFKCLSRGSLDNCWCYASFTMIVMESFVVIARALSERQSQSHFLSPTHSCPPSKNVFFRSRKTVEREMKNVISYRSLGMI